jgi:hypothetical protein
MALLAQLTDKLLAAEAANKELCLARRNTNVQLLDVEGEMAALKLRLDELSRIKAQQEAEQKELLQSIQEMRICVDALKPKPTGRVWRVSDCHSHIPSGDWAVEATESGTYGICVSSSKEERNNITVPLFNGVKASVSKRRYNGAKSIAVGDTLYMGDGKRGLVFKGLVTAQKTKGLFRSADLSVPSFRRALGERVLASGKKADLRPLDDEVEMMWDVDWSPVGPLTQKWKDYLSFSQRCTVIPLTEAPPA